MNGKGVIYYLKDEWTKIGYNDNDSINTPWIALTLQNSWTVMSGTRAVYRKVYGMVQLDIHITGGSYTGGPIIIATLPSGYRPHVQELFAAVGQLSSSPAFVPMLQINTDGTLLVGNLAGNSQFHFSGMFPIQ